MNSLEPNCDWLVEWMPCGAFLAGCMVGRMNAWMDAWMDACMRAWMDSDQNIRLGANLFALSASCSECRSLWPLTIIIITIIIINITIIIKIIIINIIIITTIKMTIIIITTINSSVCMIINNIFLLPQLSHSNALLPCLLLMLFMLLITIVIK